MKMMTLLNSTGGNTMLHRGVLQTAFYCFIAGVVFSGGCSSYTVPGKAAKMSLFTEEQGIVMSPGEPKVEKPGDIEIVDRKPTATFPANVVMVRVQEPGYKSQTASGFGTGKFSVVTVRDIEKEEDFERLSKLADLAQISPMNRLLLPGYFQSDRELRTAAARLQADMVLIYTVDTTFLNTDTSTPVSVITLGLGPTINVRVITTVSALVMDTRTGYIYGTEEETAREQATASVLTSKNACDKLRLKTERKAFEQFVNQFETLWPNIVRQYKK